MNQVSAFSLLLPASSFQLSAFSSTDHEPLKKREDLKTDSRKLMAVS